MTSKCDCGNPNGPHHVECKLLLLAKAEVCDEYIKWLAKPNNQQRRGISNAIAKLNQIDEYDPREAG